MGLVCTNCLFITFFNGIFIFLPALVIGFVVFFILLRTRFEKYITKRTTAIACGIVVIVIIAPAVQFYYITVPPSIIVRQWHNNPGQNISEVLNWMGIVYDHTYGWKSGYFYLKNGTTTTDWFTSFRWTYDEGTRIITMTAQFRNSWTLLLRLDITLVNGTYYAMTTHYLRSQNFTIFDPWMLDNTTWRGYWN